MVLCAQVALTGQLQQVGEADLPPVYPAPRSRMPLNPAYLGPYEVVSRSSKTFTLRVGAREEVFSVDRLISELPKTNNHA
jgi:hypothetical protein